MNRLVDPEHGGDKYTRPHEFNVRRQPSPAALPAQFVHGSAIGPVARLEFALQAGGATVNVELSRDAYRQLAIREGDIAYLTPTRRHQFADA